MEQLVRIRTPTKAPCSPGPIAGFDVCVDIPVAMVPINLAPDVAIMRVRCAISAIPGAQYVAVVDYSGLVPEIAWVDFSKPGTDQLLVGCGWCKMREKMLAVMRTALSGL